MCPFMALADTEDRLMKKVLEHAKQAHNIKPITPDVIEMLRQKFQP